MRKRAAFTVLAVLALVVTACGGGVPEAAAPGDTIAVHGDWTIDVYNPDGTLDEHVQFANGLHPDNALVDLVAGDQTSAGLALRLANPSGDSPCSGAIPYSCWIFEKEPPISGDHYFSGLIVTTDNGGLVLRGSLTALADGDISTVESLVQHADGQLSGLTLKELLDDQDQPAPISVAAGQTVQVEVVISFTTG